MHGRSFFLRSPLPNVEEYKGNSPRKRKPGDSPLTRGMFVGIAISMNTSLHVASALIHFQCRMLSFFQVN